MSATDATLDPNVGRLVAGKYRIDAVLGTGATGTVYRAQHAVLDRPVALKVLSPALVSNPNAQARFGREARAASKLDHPNSVQVFDYGIEPDGLTYLAMELLEGRELFRVIYDDWPLSPARIVRILSQVLSVLAAAHDAGIVHRDLKPENIMLVRRAGEDGAPDEVVKVADFGIAKTVAGPVSEESLNLTRDGTVYGTPEYMAPEQARGEELDGRADVYAVGMILYEMLVGALPFTGDAPFDVIVKQLRDPVPTPSSRRPGISPAFDAVVLRALAKDRNERFQDARAMALALEAALLGPGAATPAEGIGSGAGGGASGARPREASDALDRAQTTVLAAATVGAAKQAAAHGAPEPRAPEKTARRAWLVAAVVAAVVAVGAVGALLGVHAARERGAQTGTPSQPGGAAGAR